jgi:hypothetical protein
VKQEEIEYTKCKVTNLKRELIIYTAKTFCTVVSWICTSFIAIHSNLEQEIDYPDFYGFILVYVAENKES